VTIGHRSVLSPAQPFPVADGAPSAQIKPSPLCRRPNLVIRTTRTILNAQSDSASAFGRNRGAWFVRRQRRFFFRREELTRTFVFKPAALTDCSTIRSPLSPA
jgi:hypothetical protein